MGGVDGEMAVWLRESRFAFKPISKPKGFRQVAIDSASTIKPCSEMKIINPLYLTLERWSLNFDNEEERVSANKIGGADGLSKQGIAIRGSLEQ